MTSDTFTLQSDVDSDVETTTHEEPEQHEHDSLRNCTRHALHHFFKYLDGGTTTDLYDLVIREVEAPLMEAVMAYTHNNQSKASKILGINRGTLRKKLKEYGLL
jgi:Fis family transcriptional regulator